MKSLVIRLSSGSTSSEEITIKGAAFGGKMATRSTNGIVYQLTDSSYFENAIFDDITASENLNEVPEYRCIYLYNNGSIDGARSIIGAKLYLTGSTYAKFEMAKVTNKNTDAGVIANEKTAPSGSMSFESYTKDNKLNIGDLNVGDRIAIWIKRTPKNVGGAGSTKESLSIIVEGAQ